MKTLKISKRFKTFKTVKPCQTQSKHVKNRPRSSARAPTTEPTTEPRPSQRRGEEIRRPRLGRRRSSASSVMRHLGSLCGFMLCVILWCHFVGSCCGVKLWAHFVVLFCAVILRGHFAAFCLAFHSFPVFCIDLGSLCCVLH